MKRATLLRDDAAGLATTLVLITLLELALAAFGVEPASGSDLERGFNAEAAYIVPDNTVDGGWRTQYFDGEKPERVIPPKNDRLRVLLFGGSNTAGLPDTRLENELNRDRESARKFEVINLGRSGYGSSRVAILFEQALELLAPDIVVIYSGHNEFVERGFEMDLEANWDSGLARGAARQARHLRAFNALTRAFTDETDAVEFPKPEAWRGEFNKFKAQTYDEMLARFEIYERNLRRMCDLAKTRGVGVVLSSVVYNRVSPPRVSSFPTDVSDDDRARFERVHGEAIALLPESLRPLLPELGRDRVHGFDWKPSEIDPGVELRIPTLLERNPQFLTIDGWNAKVPKLLNAYEKLVSRAPGTSGARRGSRAS